MLRHLRTRFSRLVGHRFCTFVSNSTPLGLVACSMEADSPRKRCRLCNIRYRSSLISPNCCSTFQRVRDPKGQNRKQRMLARLLMRIQTISLFSYKQVFQDSPKGQLMGLQIPKRGTDPSLEGASLGRIYCASIHSKDSGLSIFLKAHGSKAQASCSSLKYL